jgi:Nif-specific regulatory protein
VWVRVITLKFVQGSACGQVVELEGDTVTLGRGDHNTVVLSDYHLSGEHGQIVHDAGEYIYRDLHSTNGSAIERDGRRQALDAASGYEATLRDGDRLVLGDPNQPVLIEVAIGRPARADSDGLGDRLIASRSIIDLPAVADRVEHDPKTALKLYKALAPLSSAREMREVLETSIAAAFGLLERATHVAVLMRSDADENRFTVAMARERGETGLRPSSAEGAETVRASRSVLRRVLTDRAALLTADARQDLPSSESILAGSIFSTIAVPMWRGDEIRGVVQVDNRHSSGMFNERDLEVAMLLGSHAALAVDNAALVARLTRAQDQLQGENVYLKRKAAKLRFEHIVGESAPMKQLLAQLAKVVDTRATVCIEGETGTGKELIATAVHYESRRSEHMFVAQNCAAMPENLLESELFGHRKGSFTGADSDKKGLFEIADRGTLFLDEVGEMPLSLQAKLLRTLQEGTIRAVGATSEKRVDVRIICATNRDLQAEVGRGTFRQDLYYRLMVFPVRLPPLRERRDDIPRLAEYFLRKYGDEFRRDIAGISQATMDALCAYNWPGNIRELENEIQRLVIQVENGGWIEAEHLSPQIRQVEGTVTRIAPKKGTLKEMMEQVERWLLAEALRENQNNKTQTARALGITREGLHKKLSKHGM